MQDDCICGVYFALVQLEMQNHSPIIYFIGNPLSSIYALKT